jgi:hypothetical protein
MNCRFKVQWFTMLEHSLSKADSQFVQVVQRSRASCFTKMGFKPGAIRESELLPVLKNRIAEVLKDMS